MARGGGGGEGYSLANPTPLREPQLVAYSADALALLGLDAAEVSSTADS